MTWETVIGLETHVELATQNKNLLLLHHRSSEATPTPTAARCALGCPVRCRCSTAKVLEYAVKAGLALNCQITRYSKFDRKNYFYPDLPKAYQISQLYLPIARDGAVSVAYPGGGAHHPHPRAAHGGGRGQAGPRPLAGPDPGRLQPLRRAPYRDCHRAGLPHRRRGDRLSGTAARRRCNTWGCPTARCRRALCGAT